LQEKPEAIEIAWHARPAAETFAALAAGPEGLTAQEAEARKERYGPNRLTEGKAERKILRFLRQFHNVLIYVIDRRRGARFDHRPSRRRRRHHVRRLRQRRHRLYPRGQGRAL
jgi:hypothetical protein